MKNLFAISFVLATIAIPSAVCHNNYCSMACGTIPHIGCNPGQGFDAINCGGNGQFVTLTASLKQLIVDDHNQYRDFIAGGKDPKHAPACRMATMKWNDELAYLASLHGSKCQYKHDRCHDTTTFKYSGQNLFRRSIQGELVYDDVEILKTAISAWFDESKYSNQAIIDDLPETNNGPVFEHFTVMVAESNTHVGCAAVTFKKDGKSYYMLTCNYAMDNLERAPIYSKCPRAAASCSSINPLYKNLCAEGEKYVIN